MRMHANNVSIKQIKIYI